MQSYCFMIKRFISLEWKQFTRSSYFQKSLAIKIILIFVALYFTVSFLLLGIGSYFILQDIFPDQDPINIVNTYLIFWFLLDIVYRFFIQNLPVMNVKPFMVLPIKRQTILHYLLGKTTFSFFNFLPLFFFLPFSIILLSQGYPALQVIPWFLAMLFFELSINYLNFLINKIDAVFYVLLLILLSFVGLEYFNVYAVTQTAGYVFNTIYETSYAFLMPFLLMILLYRRNYAFLTQGFYLDDQVSKKVKQVKSHEMSWLNRFGEIAVFLKNDIRMISRNIRPRKVLLTSFIFLFYGLIFYTQDIYKENFIMIAFASIFVTGGFLLTFGQLVPSWDSEYYKLLMSQNIPYRKYIESKWYLMVFGTGLAFILSTPYLYFGWKIFGLITAGALFNIGLNSFITLYGGALNPIPVKLNVKAKAFANTKGFNITQMLVALPKLLLPILLFYIPYLIFDFEVGMLVLGLSGIVGLVFKNFFLNKIETIYQKRKYKTVTAYEEAA